MFHRKRFRWATVFVLTLLLIAVMAPVASARVPPPTIDPDDSGSGVVPDTTNPPPTTGTTNPPPTNGNGGNGNGNGNGNGDMGNGDMMKPPATWPPPNAIVRHPATPVQLSSLAGGLQVYLISPDGSANNGPLLDPLSSMAEMYPGGDAVLLYEGVNPGSGKPVMIEYLPADMKLRVSTFYADKPPHDFDKAYIFTVDADHSVTHVRW